MEHVTSNIATNCKLKIRLSKIIVSNGILQQSITNLILDDIGFLMGFVANTDLGRTTARAYISSYD